MPSNPKGGIVRSKCGHIQLRSQRRLVVEPLNGGAPEIFRLLSHSDLHFVNSNILFRQNQSMRNDGISTGGKQIVRM